MRYRGGREHVEEGSLDEALAAYLGGEREFDILWVSYV